MLAPTSKRLQFSVSLREMATVYGVLLIASHFGPDQVKAVSAAVSLVFGPLLTGYGSDAIYNAIRGKRADSTISYLSLTSHWILGMICMVLTSALIAVMLPSYALAASAILIVISLGTCIILGNRTSTPLIELTPRSTVLSSILLVGVVVPFLYLRLLAPFPLTIGSDLFKHLSSIAAISSGDRGFFLNDDGFLVLVESSSMVASSSPLLTFWTGPFVQYIVMELGVYILSCRILKNEILSLAAAMIPLWFINDGIFNDLFELLARNALMAALSLFIILVLFENPIHDSRKSRLSFLMAGPIVTFYFFDLSAGQYFSSLPRILQLALQPGYVLTSPAYAFGGPKAGIQGFYALALSVAMLLVVLRLTPPEGRKAVMVWAGVSFMAISIEYRMGFLLAMVLWALLLIDSKGGPRVYALASSVGIVFPLIELSGLYSRSFASGFLRAFTTISRLNVSVSSSPGALVQMFQQSYGSFYYYLAFCAMLALVLLVRRSGRELRLLGVVMAVSLALFFSPFPAYYSVRFLFLLTPLLVMLSFAAIQAAFQTLGLLVESSRPNQPNSKSWSERLRHSIWGHKTRNLQVLKLATLAIVVLVAVSNLTGSYNFFTRTYSAAYGQTGYFSTFTPLDMQMASWMRAHLGSNTIVVSDPYTVLILTGLSSMPYTNEGDVYLTPTVTSSIVTEDHSIFLQAIKYFSLPSLRQLWELYDNSSAFEGIQPPAADVLVVVNNRTTGWVTGWSDPSWGPSSSSYLFSPSFIQFEGLGLMRHSDLLVDAVNITSNYRAFLLKVPVPQSSAGPALSVYTRQGEESINTLEESYEPTSQYYFLSLTGSNAYLVSDVPSQWTFVGASGNTTASQVSRLNQTAYLISGVSSSSQIQLRWFS